MMPLHAHCLLTCGGPSLLQPLSVTEAPASPAAASAPALPCKDDDKNCEFWAAAGECTKK